MHKKVAVITGCSSGFGYLAAIRFAQEGYHTYAGVRDISSAGSLALQKKAQEEHLSISVIDMDVSRDESVSSAVQKITKSHTSIDVLINNAGFGYLGPLELFTDEEIREQYETNIFGVLRMTRAVVPFMRAQESGTIINLSSINGLIPFPLWSVYSSSKFAVESFSEGLNFELRHFGIRVVLVEPGSFLTNFPNRARHPQALKQDTVYKNLTDRFFDRYHKAHTRARKGFFAKMMNPDRVVDLFLQIVRSSNPRTRYLIGYDAHIMYFLRRILPTSMWNAILRKVYEW